MVRVQISAVPDDVSQCGVLTWCCYRDGKGYCDTPRTNKGNSDAACHRINNAKLVALLTPVERREGE